MKKTFAVLTIILVMAGFAFPLLWIGAVIAAIIAMSAAPEGHRIDGRRKTGGLLGGMVDNIALMGKTTVCPYCQSTIMKSAQKCPNCGEWMKKQGIGSGNKKRE